MSFIKRLIGWLLLIAVILTAAAGYYVARPLTLPTLLLIFRYNQAVA